jgi:hypothetical protein
MWPSGSRRLVCYLQADQTDVCGLGTFLNATTTGTVVQAAPPLHYDGDDDCDPAAPRFVISPNALKGPQPGVRTPAGGQLMASKEPCDKEQIGDADEGGLFLISDRTLYWESFQRREPKPARERLGPLNPTGRQPKL